jgi:hypothetical protein
VVAFSFSHWSDASRITLGWDPTLAFFFLLGSIVIESEVEGLRQLYPDCSGERVNELNCLMVRAVFCVSSSLLISAESMAFDFRLSRLISK